MQKTINGAIFRKMILAAANLLEQHKDYVDALNVYPVPDGDTGTNMNLTFKSAAKYINECTSNSLDALGEALQKGALRGARGNSGVILSQILKGIASVMMQYEELDTKKFAKALHEGANIAYKAVTVPKEGTILTVIRGMSDFSLEVCKKVNDFEEFFKLVLEEGERVLAKTPDMLPVLKKAGVVDAGGRGLLVLLTGFYRVIADDDSVAIEFNDPSDALDRVRKFHETLTDLSSIEFAYCTEFMVVNMHKRTTESDIDVLRERLMSLGDQVICMGDLKLVKVHVHTNEPNRALGYALELGELANMKIENMLEQVRELQKATASDETNMKQYGMVAIAAGEGLLALFKDLMVDHIVEGGQTMNPSADDIAEAVGCVHATNVFVLPNNKNIILAAEQAKALTNKNIIVIPSKSVPEGISACLAFNEEGSIEENIEAMAASMAHVKTGSVTYAVRETHVDGFDLAINDIIGLDKSAIVTKGAQVSETTEKLIAKLIDKDSVNISLFYGNEVKEEDAVALQEKLTAKYPQCEISVIRGGQPVYYYIISVE